MQNNCPRCQAIFDCQKDHITNCNCTTIQLSPHTQKVLKQSHFKSCLCPDCLQSLETLSQKMKQYPFPSPPKPLIQGLHYYQEKGLWVFTEFYHFSRGYCCQSACRHCAYGFKKSSK